MAFRDDVLGSLGPRACAPSRSPAARRSSRRPATGATRSSISSCPIASATARRPRGRCSIAAIPPAHGRPGFRFDRWAQSGGERYQGGTIAGITSKLDYLADSGRQHALGRPGLQAARASQHLPRLRDPGLPRGRSAFRHARGPGRAGRGGARQGHARHPRRRVQPLGHATGSTPTARWSRPFVPFPQFYQKGDWIDGDGKPRQHPADRPPWTPACGRASCSATTTTRARAAASFDGELRRRSRGVPPHRLLRPSRLQLRRHRGARRPGALLQVLDRAHRLRRLSPGHAQARVRRRRAATSAARSRNSPAISARPTSSWSAKSPAADDDADKYRRVLGQNLNATLDIGEMRRVLHGVAKGLQAPRGVSRLRPHLGRRPRLASRLGHPPRLGARRSRSRLGRQDPLLDRRGLGVAGGCRRGAAALHARHPVHLLRHGAVPRRTGEGGARSVPAGLQRQHRHGSLPARDDVRAAPSARRRPRRPRAGRRGTRRRAPRASGRSARRASTASTPAPPAYVRIAALTAVRRDVPGPARAAGSISGRSRISSSRSRFPGPGELIAWSRILDDEEALCIVNGHGTARRGGDVLVDARLNAQARRRNWSFSRTPSRPRLAASRARIRSDRSFR